MIDTELEKAQFTGARDVERYWRDVEGWYDYAVSERRYMEYRQRTDNETAFIQYWERRCMVTDPVELARLDQEAASYWDERYVEYCEFMTKPVGQYAEELYDDWADRVARQSAQELAHRILPRARRIYMGYRRIGREV
jgi:hypothetical protein